MSFQINISYNNITGLLDLSPVTSSLNMATVMANNNNIDAITFGNFYFNFVNIKDNPLPSSKKAFLSLYKDTFPVNKLVV